MDIIASWILKYFLRVEKKKNQVCVKESEDSIFDRCRASSSISELKSRLSSHKRLEKGGSSILSISKIVMMPSVLVIWQQKIFKNYHHDF